MVKNFVIYEIACDELSILFGNDFNPKICYAIHVAYQTNMTKYSWLQSSKLGKYIDGEMVHQTNLTRGAM